MKKYLFIIVFIGFLLAGNILFASTGGGHMDISEKGMKFIADKEGFKGKMYNDAAGNSTIGYGHLIHSGPIDGTEPDEFLSGITKDQGLALFKQDLQPRVETVNRLVQYELTQDEFDALVSFVYNVGEGAFARSTVLAAINGDKFDEVPQDLDQYDHAGGKVLAGLLKRRQEEGQAFA